ncbi:MAG: hypothetical protein IKO59_06365 [Bacteroidales bacterium]|nr:hypothetical protein [Bacteroidales bacterium]
MTVKIVRVSASAYVDIGNIARFIVSVSRLSHAERYVDEINEELKSLGFLATVIPETAYSYPKRFHPKAKMMKMHKKPLCVIFHIEGDYVIVDRILPAAMVAY